MDAMLLRDWLAMLSGDLSCSLHDGVAQAAMLLCATAAVMNHCYDVVALHADDVRQWRLQSLRLALLVCYCR